MSETETQEQESSLEDKVDAESVKDSKEIVVFDSLDTIQGYVGAAVGKSKAYYLQKTAEAHGMTVEEMEKNVPVDTYLAWTADLLREGVLVPRIIDGVESLLRDYISQGIRPVVITADRQDSADMTSAPIVKKRLIRKQDVHGIQHIGSKKKPETWKQALDLYDPGCKVVAVYEDTQANLEAAVIGYKCPGYLAKETSSGISCTPYTAK